MKKKTRIFIFGINGHWSIENKSAMKRFDLFLILFTLTLKISAGTDYQLLDSANSAYSKKEYSKAVTLYEKVLAQGTEAPELYFNLGNAWFKTNNMPKAILNYERARRLKPDDEATLVNLKMANARIADKIEEGPQHFITGWKIRFLNLFSERIWSMGSIVLFVFCLCLLLVYFVSRRVWLRQLSFVCFLLFLGLSAFTCLTAWNKNELSLTHSEAIVMAPNVSAKGSPDEKGTDLFILHEGTKVFLIQKNDGWTEIKLTNGNTGWLPRSAFEVI
jgi:tetratricopeptide (TPR) repeat protein